MPSIEGLMATDMISAAPDETVAEVAKRMSRNHIGAMLVVENGAISGLFTERDLLDRVTARNRNPKETRVAEVATREVVTVDASQPVQEVLALFRAKKFRHLPVTKGGKLVGILSTRDLLAYSVEVLERYIIELKYNRELAEGVDPYDHFGGSYGR